MPAVVTFGQLPDEEAACDAHPKRIECGSGPERPTRHDAVVAGGSPAGRLAARVLCNHFVRVALPERDHFPETPIAKEYSHDTA